MAHKIVYSALRQKVVDEAEQAIKEIDDFCIACVAAKVSVPNSVLNALARAQASRRSQLKAWRDEARGKYDNDPNWANMDPGRNNMRGGHSGWNGEF